jgi:hypothetical protein
VARSTYVYVIMDYAGPVAGFTVKRELAQYLKDNLDALEHWRVWRLTDSPYLVPFPVRVQMDVDTTTGELL